MLESFSSNDFPAHFSLNNRLCSYLHIIQSSLSQTRHNDASISSFIEVNTIVWDRGRDDAGMSVHEVRL